MRIHVLPVLLFAGLTAATLPAKAALVTYEFTSVVTSVSGGPALAGVTTGTTVTGSFTVEDATTASAANSDTARYGGAVRDMQFRFAGHEFALASSGPSGTVVVDDYMYDNNLGTASAERAYAIVNVGYGDSLTLDGTALDYGYGFVDLFDVDQLPGGDDAITSFAFPDFSALSLEDFNSTVTLLGAVGGEAFQMYSNLTSLTRVGGGVASVPELDPTSASSAVALVAGAASTLRTRRRRA